MSVIAATSRTIKTLADGTLRLTVDIEPLYAQSAFQLFGTPDTPIALARITSGAAQDAARAETIANDKPSGGALSKLAGIWCKDPSFWEWLETDEDNACHSERGAALCIYGLCGIQSRVELDHSMVAADAFERLIRKPYMEYLRSYND